MDKNTKPTRSPRVSRRTRQFGIRQIGVLTAVIALICVPLSAFVRSLPAEKQSRAVFAMLIAVVVCVGAIGFAFVRRIRAERIAGALQLRVPTAATKAFHVTNLFSCCAFVVAASLVFYGYVTERDWFEGVGIYFVQGVIWMGTSATYLMSLWCGIDPTLIEFCENGYIQSGVNVAPWSAFRAYRWGKIDSNELFLLLDGDFNQFNIALELRSAVEEHLVNAGLPNDPDWK